MPLEDPSGGVRWAAEYQGLRLRGGEGLGGILVQGIFGAAGMKGRGVQDVTV